MPDIARELRAARPPLRKPIPIKTVVSLAVCVALFVGYAAAQPFLKRMSLEFGITTYRCLSGTAVQGLLAQGAAGLDALIGMESRLNAAQRAFLVDELSSTEGATVDAFIMKALSDKEPLVRGAAIQACSQRRMTAATPTLGKMAATDPHCSVMARLALFTLGGPEAVTEAKRVLALPSPSDPVQQTAFLRDFFAAVPVLQGACPDELKARLRQLAQFGFGDEKTEPQSPDFLAELPELEAAARYNALLDLRRMKADDPDTIKALNRIYLEPRRLYLRRAAAAALRQVKQDIPDVKKYEEEKETNRRRAERMAAEAANKTATPAIPGTTPAAPAAPATPAPAAPAAGGAK